MVIPLLGQPVPMPDQENFPNIQFKLLLVQLGAISHCPVSGYLEESDPYLDTTTSFGSVLESSDGNAVS